MTDEPCQSFANYRGIFSPRCNCYPCWDLFFKANSMRMYTSALALDKFGPAPLIVVQGKKYVKALKRFIKEEEARGFKII